MLKFLSVCLLSVEKGIYSLKQWCDYSVFLSLVGSIGHTTDVYYQNYVVILFKMIIVSDSISSYNWCITNNSGESTVIIKGAEEGISLIKQWCDYSVSLSLVGGIKHNSAVYDNNGVAILFNMSIVSTSRSSYNRWITNNSDKSTVRIWEVEVLIIWPKHWWYSSVSLSLVGGVVRISAVYDQNFVAILLSIIIVSHSRSS